MVTTEFVRVGDIRDDEKKINIFSSILGCIVMYLSFLLFLSTTIGLSKVMNLLVSGDIGLGLFMICVLLVFACWSIVVFLLDRYFLSRSKKEYVLLLLGGYLLLLSAMITLGFLIWSGLTTSFSVLLYTGTIRTVYTVLLGILVGGLIVHFRFLRRRRNSC